LTFNKQQILRTNQSNEAICAEMTEKIEQLEQDIAEAQAKIEIQSDALERSRTNWLNTISEMCHYDIWPYKNVFFQETPDTLNSWQSGGMASLPVQSQGTTNNSSTNGYKLQN
jgi:hypothetical protein